MATAIQFQKKLQPLLSLQNLQEIAAREIVKESDTISERKEAEFNHGDRPDGSEIGVYRNSAYARFKNALNPAAGGYVDLKLTGRFANSAYLRKPKNGRYLLAFSDSKAAMLLAKYNKMVGGQKDLRQVSQKWFDEFQLNTIKARFVKEIKKQIGQ